MAMAMTGLLAVPLSVPGGADPSPPFCSFFSFRKPALALFSVFAHFCPRTSPFLSRTRRRPAFSAVGGVMATRRRDNETTRRQDGCWLIAVSKHRRCASAACFLLEAYFAASGHWHWIPSSEYLTASSFGRGSSSWSRHSCACA